MRANCYHAGSAAAPDDDDDCDLVRPLAILALSFVPTVVSLLAIPPTPLPPPIAPASRTSLSFRWNRLRSGARRSVLPAAAACSSLIALAWAVRVASSGSLAAAPTFAAGGGGAGVLFGEDDDSARASGSDNPDLRSDDVSADGTAA
eukprot:CAMPEP_0113562256 /NCGR_PEP_ID=MMETSP0015_2-20120614/20425_1 /TAXON_ID=2838 /ORGANISM="Odontella" /LENGTH=146 /DNA_ID=CAMNT_0000464131 /DNA_START=27 /DNA_END=463 /DNA_ORIENTATION=+ /assembly_acc=CAM_ASM_000160